jgi:hypothetical protein
MGNGMTDTFARRINRSGLDVDKKRRTGGKTLKKYNNVSIRVIINII